MITAMEEVQKKADELRQQIIHKVYVFTFFIFLIFSNLALIFSGKNRSVKLELLPINLILCIVFLLCLYLIKRRLSEMNLRYVSYMSLSFAYVIWCVIVGWDRYLSTVGITFCVLSILIYFSYSKVHFLTASFLSLALIIFITISAIHKTVTFSYGYPIISVSSFIILIYVLYCGIEMQHEIDRLIAYQMNLLQDANENLATLNEEYLASEEEITDQYEKIVNLNKQLQWNMTHSALTKLYNREGLIDALEDMDAYVIIKFNINDFNYIITSLGYSTGDKVLQSVPPILTKFLPDTSPIAHLEQERFVVAASIDSDVHALLGQIEAELKHVAIDDLTLNLDITVGVAENDGSLSALQTLKNAEISLFEAQEKHTRLVFYHNSFAQKTDRKFMLLHSLDSSIHTTELFNVYQPKIDIATNKIVGFEALARWNSPIYGFIPPDEFILLAEQTGRIIALGDFLMKRAMSFAAKATAADPDLVISINLSPLQLADDCFFDMIHRNMAETGVSARNIGFEITETAYISNFDFVKKVIIKLHDMGFEIYLDDFGKGYSSLSYLNNLPIDILKIDKSFIDSVHTDQASLNLLKTIVSLAKSFGLHTVAEGVEYDEQYQILKQEACDCIQGYYFYRPLSEAQALESICS